LGVKDETFAFIKLFHLSVIQLAGLLLVQTERHRFVRVRIAATGYGRILIGRSRQLAYRLESAADSSKNQHSAQGNFEKPRPQCERRWLTSASLTHELFRFRHRLKNHKPAPAKKTSSGTLAWRLTWVQTQNLAGYLTF
jgi:hypothetical protein